MIVHYISNLITDKIIQENHIYTLYIHIDNNRNIIWFSWFNAMNVGSFFTSPSSQRSKLNLLEQVICGTVIDLLWRFVEDNLKFDLIRDDFKASINKDCTYGSSSSG